jgi:hypothetical protein
MIRTLSVLALAMASTSAYATPRLGDYAAFNAVLSLNGQTMQADVQQEIVQHDTSKNEFLERQTVAFSGRSPEVTDSWKAADQFLDDATIEAVLGNCAAAGGTAQAITVPAGTFDTCAMPFDNEGSKGIVWIAKVPFGVAKLDQLNKENGLTVAMELRSFR